MLAYYFRLGVRSLLRNPILTMLMVLTIGIGVASSMTTYAVFRAVSANPLPEKSLQLFAPQIDIWGPQSRAQGADMPDALTYTDAMALLRDKKARRQTAIYPVNLTLVPQDERSEPFAINGYAAYADFFSMFKAPFLYGGAWNMAQDDTHAAVVVISSQLNQQLFQGSDSVGSTIRLDDHDYEIVGVVDGWNPKPRFYDVNNSDGFNDAPDIFLPFTRGIDLQINTNGNTNCYGSAGRNPGFDGFIHSDCAWVSYWAELPDAKAEAAYRDYLTNYAADQNRAGRFHWKPYITLRNLVEWLDYEKVVPPETRISLWLSLGFLLVCLINTIGLMLAKFMRRAGEIGVRRALGASRKEIWTQFLFEAAMVGVGGGVVGVVFTGLGALSVGLVFEPDIARLARVNTGLIGLTLVCALVSTLAAAFYPIWRASRVQPAWQLKSN